MQGMFTSEDDEGSNWNEDVTLNSECTTHLGFFETVGMDSDEEKKESLSKEHVRTIYDCSILVPAAVQFNCYMGNLFFL